MHSTVIVTGASSFIGMHIAKYLVSLNYNVIATVSKIRCKYQGIQEQRLRVLENAGIRLEQLDLTCVDQILKIVDSYRPQYWIQHAGWAQDYASWNFDFERAFMLNIKPLKDIYLALAKVGSRGLILTGSDAEYGDIPLPFKEEGYCKPTLPYGLSKLMQSSYARQLAEHYKVKTRVARVFIPFGELDNPNKLLPTVIERLRSNQSIGLSPCTQSRDFVYVDDLVEGYHSLMRDLDRDTLFDAFNLASGHPTSLKQLLTETVWFFNKPIELLQFGVQPMRENENMNSYADISKAKIILNWQPRLLEITLKQYLSSYGQGI